MQILKGRAFQAVGPGHTKILCVSKHAMFKEEQGGHVATSREYIIVGDEDRDTDRGQARCVLVEYGRDLGFYSKHD